MSDSAREHTAYTVEGTITFFDDFPAANIEVLAFDRDLRHEQLLGQCITNAEGFYHISYSPHQFCQAEKSNADLVIKALAPFDTVLTTSSIVFNAPHTAQVNLTLPADALLPPSLFERLQQTLSPLTQRLNIKELEQNNQFNDLTFLSGETGYPIEVLARFALAHRLAEKALPPAFWFALLGSSLYRYRQEQSLKEHAGGILKALSSLSADTVRKALKRSFNNKEIPEALQKHTSEWIEAFLIGVARLAVSTPGDEKSPPVFIKSALEEAKIQETSRQEAFARIFQAEKKLTPHAADILEKEHGFKPEEIADLRTSFALADLTQGDFSIVSQLKKEFKIRHPERIRRLAKKSQEEWIHWVRDHQATGNITLPLEKLQITTENGTHKTIDSAAPDVIAKHATLPTAYLYGTQLERQFREAFPTTAFAGGLERALEKQNIRGLKHAEGLSRFLNQHDHFELLHTPLDDFLKHHLHPDFQTLAKNESFQLELKAVQRLFKLTPNFEATDQLLADHLHSAQQVYRLGKTEFVRRYAERPGFTAETAALTWNRAADTHAAVLTLVADLKSLDAEALPQALSNNNQALSSFPHWNNLFKSGDVCECESCRSVLSPAAYYADLLMFLKDRKAANPAQSVKDILFNRRPDLGFIELNCENALTPFPYIDTVCEVLEEEIAQGENDLELIGLSALPADPLAAKTAVEDAFNAHDIRLGEDFTLSQISASDPDRWVAHGDDITYLLKKKTTLNFFAEILRNTKASAETLRAYPAYVNPKAYDKLRAARYPLSLPFDLFAEEVRAAFQKSQLHRWDIMGTFQGVAAPNNPSEGDIAAEYFSISTNTSAAFDEKRLICVADTSAAGQHVLWGDSAASWLDHIANVKNFLQKTLLNYNDMLALLDLKFINPTGDIVVHHLDASCDTNNKVLTTLDATKLDRIHRFLRLWRKLNGWKLWELDLVIRHPHIGKGLLDEAFLIHLFYFNRLKQHLGTTAEQLCALFGDLNTETRFTQLHEKREDALYQTLFLNKRLIHPLDPAFQIDPTTHDLPVGKTITAHHSVVLAALGLRETDLLTLKDLTKASDASFYINDDLTLSHLSFLWRHAWLAKLLKFNIEQWKTLLKLFQHDLVHVVSPKTAWLFIEDIRHLKASGFTPDELNWLLSADRSAKAAVKEADASRFLGALRKTLKGIQAEYSAAHYPFLTAVPPTDTDSLITLLTSLLQKLHRNDADAEFFVATLKDEVNQSEIVAGLPAGFDFPLAIKTHIRIHYDEPSNTLRFTGFMTVTERNTLLTDVTLAAVTGLPAYQQAIETFFRQPRLALKFFDPMFTVPLAHLPAAVEFQALPTPLAQKISYDAEQRLLRFTGILTPAEHAALDALSAEADYRAALHTLATQPGLILAPNDQLWLLEADLHFPLRDLTSPANDPLAPNLVTTITKALAYLSNTLSEEAVIQQASTQWGLTEALTRHLLADYPILPDTLMTHLTGPFAATLGVVDIATLTTTFEGWFWAGRAATLLKKWNLTLAEWTQLNALSAPAQSLVLLDLPLNDSDPITSIETFLNTSRLLRIRDALPETKLAFIDILEKLNHPPYTDADFAIDVEYVNEAWPADDVDALVNLLNLTFPDDYLLAETWERLHRAFYFMNSLNASANTLKHFAATAMTFSHAKTLKELLRAKLGTESWQVLSTEIQDALRERKRDALIAYLLTQPQPAEAPSGKWENASDLYAYYLLDVEMCSCQLTSRLVQASGSIQLFVQRCFMGLEPEVVVQAEGDNGDSAWRWWGWMRKYRVWEANRKVFLWPENWIEPELKKDRSTFFKDLENELLQNDSNATTVETAFSNYLEKLDGVAQLEIAGFFQEDDGDQAIIHVFGRNKGTEPHLYYYRRYDYRQWTPWEKVDLDIQGDYLSPAVVNKRLYLFWPIFTEVPDELGNSTVPTPRADQASVPVHKAKKKLQLQIAVSEYRQGLWTPKKVSKDFDQSAAYDVAIVRNHYRFFPIDRSEVDGRFGLMYEGYSTDANGNIIYGTGLNGAFEIAGCKGVPEKTSLPGRFVHAIRPEREATGNNTHFLKWVEHGTYPAREDAPENDFTLENSFAAHSDALFHTPVLMETPGLFKMTPPWHLSYLDKLWLELSSLFQFSFSSDNRLPTPVGTWLPFFYNDKKRTFFVLPTLGGNRYQRDPLAEGNIRLYYPDIKKTCRQLENTLEGHIQTWLDSIDFSALTVDERQQLEHFLRAAFPEEVPPPYTEAQLTTLILRWLMRYFRYYLGALSLQQFQFRQFHFKNHYHPFVCDFAKLVYNPLKGIPALMSRETQLKNTGFRFKQSYAPTPWVIESSSEKLYPQEVVDFSPDGAYSPYNWELFFHAPLLIANALSRNQRFEEARNWYHFIFNPIGVESSTPGGSALSKYWVTKPFYETTDPQYVQQRIDHILRLLAGDTRTPGYSAQTKKDLEDQVRDWRTNPFEPHRLANYRTVAYQKTVVMKYIDNLVAWGDSLFRQDSMESINEATQLYILAAEILGPRPKKVPPQTRPPLESFNELENQFDAFSNALVEIENLIPVLPGNGENGSDNAPLPMLYFCIPYNDKMLGYWDTVADRLYKIRHCMNIEGVVRQLALFEPPIDPAALVKTIVGGLDSGAALADLNTPLPLYRFNVLLQKANEMCNDVKALGSALLSALEKKDAEALSLLRQNQEIRVLQAVKSLMEQHIDEAKESLKGMQKSKELALIKQQYYGSRDYMNAGETAALALNTASTALDIPVSVGYITAGVLTLIPNFLLGASGFGGSPHATAATGGTPFGDSARFAAEGLSHLAKNLDKMASLSSAIGSYDRRKDEWEFQKNLTDKEIEQIDSSMANAELRIAMTEKELQNHTLQIENAQATDAFMHSKYTNQELYQWQISQISSTYFQSYKLAYDLAKRTERCFRFELGLQDSSYISFGYWDSLKKGLLSGEKLQYDLRRLENAYLEQNRREFELNKNISLAMLDPVALIQLRETGRCFLRLPEEFFDLDFPGHYFRRIKSVSITLPCVVGPYTTISCTLRLLKNSIRITTANGDNGYPRNTDDQGLPADDSRFIENGIPVKAIAASQSQNDSGLFELNFRDERYLPFEGAGVISEWSLELFNDLPSNNPDPAHPDFGKPLRQFDYGTLSDAILHIKYTAREDAGAFKNGALSHLRHYLSQDDGTPSLRLFNLRQDFPSQWHRFLHPSIPANGNIFELQMSPQHFRLLDDAKTLHINTVMIFARCTDSGNYSAVLNPPLTAGADTFTLAKSTQNGLHFGFKDIAALGIEVVPNEAPIWSLKMTRPGGGSLQEDPATHAMEVADLMVVLGYTWKV